jgi:hypothetical protein
MSARGDGLTPHPVSTATRAITIHAPADRVWPWIKMMLGIKRLAERQAKI